MTVPLFERRSLSVDLLDGIREVEVDAVVFMQRANEVAHLGSEHALHRPLLRSDDVHVELARPQGRRDLEADEARADHEHAFRAARRLDDGAAVGKGAQDMDMRLLGAGDRQFDWLGAGREQQPVEWQPVAIAQRHAARLRIDRGHIGVEPEVDAGVRVVILAGRSGSQSSGALPAR